MQQLSTHRTAAALRRRSDPAVLHTAAAVVVLALILPLTASAFGEPLRKSAETADDGPCRRAQFRVVVDVGHSAESPGAMSARGVPEYEFNLSLAWWIERALIAAGFEQAVRLISAGPAIPSLYRRVAHANRLPADLFLSIHHDSVPKWFLQSWDHGGDQLPYSDRFKGHSIFVSYANGHRAGSLRFARLLGQQMKAYGLHYTPHYTRADMRRYRRKLVDAEAGVYRYDRLIVLRATRMPAVLLEAASIINRDEELLATAPARRALVAAAVTRAVEQFCAVRARRAIARGKRVRPSRAARPRIRKKVMPAQAAGGEPHP